MTKKINEGLAELASTVDQDHEVQMARADLYKIAKYAIKLHELLKNVTEQEGLEGWQQAKITKAADYIGSVYHSLEYDKKVMTPESRKRKSTMSESEQTEYKALLEKAKSKAQQKFMGMVHAAQKGEKLQRAKALRQTWPR
jgi:dynactin complex subunit